LNGFILARRFRGVLPAVKGGKEKKEKRGRRNLSPLTAYSPTERLFPKWKDPPPSTLTEYVTFMRGRLREAEAVGYINHFRNVTKLIGMGKAEAVGQPHAATGEVS
jgi:hypothetical protein